MRIIDENQLDYCDVLIQPQRSFQLSRKDIKLERDFYFYHSPRVWTGFPLIISPMPYLATMKIAKIIAEYNSITCLHKFYSEDELFEFFSKEQLNLNYIWYTTGVTDKDLEKLDRIFSRLHQHNFKPPNICIDAATAYSDFFIKQALKIRQKSPESIIMAGNCCDGNTSIELIIYAKVDIVKVGIGPSPVCATRRVTAVGRPQLSSIIDCANACHGLKNGPKKLGLICADGGISEIGDFCKAFGAGSDFIMSSTFFSGSSDCEGEWKDNKLKIYGLSSYEAQSKHYGEIKDYRASEGECFWIDKKPEISNILKEIQGGIRSCCTYINSPSIRDMSKCTQFYKVNRQKGV